MSENRAERLIAFFSGDAAVSIAFIWLSDEAMHILLKIFLTVLMGLVGGFTGLAGKDLYNYCKCRIQKWREK